jgi:hypothetical protein
MCLLKAGRAPVQRCFFIVLNTLRWTPSNRLTLGVPSPAGRSQKQTDGGGFEPPVPFGTHAFQACTINRSVTHPNAAHFNCKSAVREADSLRALICCSRRPAGDVIGVTRLAPCFPRGKRLQTQARRAPLQVHSCRRRNNSSSGNWMPM